MGFSPASAARWLFDSGRGLSDRLIPRWLFLRALALIYFSAFFSLVFQIRGLIGPQGILPAYDYLQAMARTFPLATRLWYAPTLLWISSGNGMLLALCWIGMAASLLLLFNFWPRGMLVLCFLCFLSFVSAAQDFSGYQSDGMLLEAGFIALFFAPPGFRPGLAPSHPPSRASLFLLQWEWFRIYFESGVAKIASGDPSWRNMTAMDDYYQNGPLPTWIGWYMQHLPHSFHAFTAYATLALELGLVWLLFLPRRLRILCFFIVTPWELGVITTANYTFLNYLVLSLGILLLDDRLLRNVFRRWRDTPPSAAPGEPVQATSVSFAPSPWRTAKLALSSALLASIFYVTALQLLWMLLGSVPLLPAAPVIALEPFRIANRYGLFAMMTHGRYEIEFQGSDDGQNWTPYPFRFKPQDPARPPGIYAPYQPRFDWNLWFASLGSWREYPIVPNTEVALLTNPSAILPLFASNPFPNEPPQQVRAVLWQYWFTSMQEKKTQGLWWKREMLGLYAPALRRTPDGHVVATEWPEPRVENNR